MVTYAAIDLHSNNGVLAVIDENDRVLRQKKLPNRLSAFLDELESYRSSLAGVAVESTFNWYWLVDGLMKNGYEAKLVNTSAIQQYSGLKHSDDEYDAWWLAHMMRLGILPTGHIYPRDERAVRDLLRKRTTLVQQRTSNVLSIRNLEQRNRATRVSTKEARALTAEKVDAMYDNECVYGAFMGSPISRSCQYGRANPQRRLAAARWGCCWRDDSAFPLSRCGVVGTDSATVTHQDQGSAGKREFSGVAPDAHGVPET